MKKGYRKKERLKNNKDLHRTHNEKEKKQEKPSF